MAWLSRKTQNGEPQEAQAAHVGARASTSSRPLPTLDEARFPPIGRGIPVYDPADLVQLHADLIFQIRLSSGTTETEFADLYMPAILRYAAFVHALPASQSHHHRTPGGMLRHGLEVAFLALRKSDGKIFSRTANRANDRHDEPRWRFAVFIAGLCHDLGKVIGDIEVRSPDAMHRWNPFIENLFDWALRLDMQAFYPQFRLHRVHGVHEVLTASAIDRVLLPEHRSYLAAGHADVLTHLMLALQGSRAIADNIVYELVTAADQASVAKAIANETQLIDGIAVGVSAPEKWLSIARRFVDGKKWKPNLPGGNLYVADGAVYLAWPSAHNDVLLTARTEGGTSIPEDPQVMAAALVEHGLATPGAGPDGAARRLVRITPRFETTSVLQPRWAIQLAKSDSLYPNDLPTSIPIDLEDASPVRVGEGTDLTQADIDGCATTTTGGDAPVDEIDSSAPEGASPPDSAAAMPRPGGEPPQEDQVPAHAQSDHQAEAPSHDESPPLEQPSTHGEEGRPGLGPPQESAESPPLGQGAPPPASTDTAPNRPSVLEGDSRHARRLRAAGAGGRVLAACVDAMNSGDLAYPTHVFVVHGAMHLDLAAISEVLGFDPGRSGAHLAEAELISINPKRPNLVQRSLKDSTGAKRVAAQLTERAAEIVQEATNFQMAARPQAPTSSDGKRAAAKPASPAAPEPLTQTTTDTGSSPHPQRSGHLPVAESVGASQPSDSPPPPNPLPSDWTEVVAAAEALVDSPPNSSPAVRRLGDYLAVSLKPLQAQLKSAGKSARSIKEDLRKAGPRVFMPALLELGFRPNDLVFLIARDGHALSPRERNEQARLIADALEPAA